MSRKRKVNYKQIIKNTVEQYPDGPWHGLQKDAIQNSWDARKNKKGTDWKVEFDLISKHGNDFFIIQDFGTTGLTGNKIADDFGDPEDIPEEERWAKFECYGATKEDPNKLGSRGQGKFLFIHASGDGKIFYDSLREDGTYKFGVTENDAEDLNCWDESDAESNLKKMTRLKKISGQGSRIIIEKPKKEFVKYYKENFLDAIEETWWPLIKKFGINIILKENGKEFAKAKVPDIFNNIASQKINEEKKSINFQYGRTVSEEGKIKHLHIACCDYDLPEKFFGITVFRDGMKVLTIPFDGSLEHNKKIFGYAEFDSHTDKLLRKVENPNHYGFIKEPVWKSAEEKIKSILRLFAEEKLGIGKKEHKEKVDSQRSRKVVALMNNVLKELDIPISGATPGPNPRPNPTPPHPSPSPPPKDICIYDDRVFYTENYIKRISYGDILKCSCKIKNDISKKLRIKISIYSKTKDIFNMKDSSVDSKNNVEAEKKITSKNLDKGEYSVRFQLVDELNKDILDEKVHKLWVEDYPPGKSPFEITHSTFPEDKKDEEWFLDYEAKKLDINIGHSYYKHIQEKSDDYFLSRHDAEIGAIAAISFVIREIELGRIKKSDLENNKLFCDLLSNDNMKKMFASLRIQGKIRNILYGSEN